MKMPEMIFVDSTSIEAIGYVPDSHELYVKFLKSGETYVYYEVEEWEFEEFKQADSKGTYYNSKIKPNHPHYAKL
jgi:hypothetical protein